MYNLFPVHGDSIAQRAAEVNRRPLYFHVLRRENHSGNSVNSGYTIADLPIGRRRSRHAVFFHRNALT